MSCFFCPFCQDETEARVTHVWHKGMKRVDNLPIHPGFVLRNRKCTVCLKSFRTLEYPFESFDNVALERLYEITEREKKQKAREAEKVAKKSYKRSS